MKKFDYRLKALQRKNEWEKSAARQDMVVAKDELEEMKYQEKVLNEKVVDIEDQVRNMTDKNSVIDPDSFVRAMQYMAAKREDLVEGQSNTEKAQGVYDEKFEEYISADKNVKVIERHKSRDYKKYIMDENIEFYKESDDLWLSRKGDKDE